MKRLKAILKWMAIGTAVLVAIALLCNAYYVATTGAKLASRLEDLRKAGEPVQLSDLAREPVPAEENAAVVLGRATDGLKQVNREIESLLPKSPTGPCTLTKEEQEGLAKIFAANSQVLTQIKQATDCKVYDWQIDYSQSHSVVISDMIDHVGDQRAAVRILRARTALLVNRGQQEEALENVLQMLRLARLSNQESCLIQYLVGCAIRGIAMDAANQWLQMGSVSAEMHKALEDELKQHHVLEDFAHGLKTERAAVLSGIDELPGAKYWVSRGMVNEGKLRLLEMFERILAEGSLESGEKSGELGNDDSSFISVYVILIDKLLAPAVESSSVAMKRNLASLRALRILNAIQAQKLPAEEVPNLEGLGLEPSEIVDPFNGKTMIVKKLPEGWLVYSVGANRIDDGGNVATDVDVGCSPLPPPPPQNVKSPFAP